MGNQQVKFAVYIAYDDENYYIGKKHFNSETQFDNYKTSSTVKKFHKKILNTVGGGMDAS